MRKVDFPRHCLSAVLMEEVWVGTPATRYRAVASPGAGGLAGTPLSLSMKGWVGCRLGEAGEGQAGEEACWGTQATARPVMPQGNSHWSTLQTGHSQTSLSARSPELHMTAR